MFCNITVHTLCQCWSKAIRSILLFKKLRPIRLSSRCIASVKINCFCFDNHEKYLIITILFWNFVFLNLVVDVLYNIFVDVQRDDHDRSSWLRRWWSIVSWNPYHYLDCYIYVRRSSAGNLTRKNKLLCNSSVKGDQFLVPVIRLCVVLYI